MAENESEKFGGETATVIDDKVEEPSRYRVLLHNDDYTSMDFVIMILRGIFHKNAEDARAITMKVHLDGIGECGTFTREIAESKVGRVRQEARQAGFPLKCTMEKI